MTKPDPTLPDTTLPDTTLPDPTLPDPTFEDQLLRFVGQEIGVLQPGPDEINVPMVRHWCETMGDSNPIYLDQAEAEKSVHGGLVAPPTMLQAWVMRPYNVARDSLGVNPYSELTALIESAGLTSVVAVNCEQTYDRYLRPGDRITMRTVIDAVSPEKVTGLGTGRFVTTRQDYFDADGQRVGSMLFRILRFKPTPKAAEVAAEASPSAFAATPDKPRGLRPRPSLTHDQQFWFEGLQQGQLLIQKCSSCGALRHPAGPMCRTCQSLLWETITAVGGGAIHSFAVVHYPQIPSLDYPNQVVLVDLDEGVRIIANTIDTERSQLAIGARVQLAVRACDPGLSLPFFTVVQR